MEDAILSKNSKASLIVYGISLLIILYGFSETVGFLILFSTGLLTLFTCVSIAHDIKKFNNSTLTNVWNVTASNFLLYTILLLFYGLGNIGVGVNAGILILTVLSYQFFWVVGSAIGVIAVVKSKDHSITSNPAKKLSLGLVIVFGIFIYSTFISFIAHISANPQICTLHAELQKDSFIFYKGFKDMCISDIAVSENNSQHCMKIEDEFVDHYNSRRDACLMTIASNLNDDKTCLMIADTDKQKICLDKILLKNTSN